MIGEGSLVLLALSRLLLELIHWGLLLLSASLSLRAMLDYIITVQK